MNRRITCTIAVALLAGCGTSSDTRFRNLTCVGFCSQQDSESHLENKAKEPPPKPLEQPK